MWLCYSIPALAQDAEIHGVLNAYTAVMSINDDQSLAVDNASDFHPQDTVLLIQMTGVDSRDGNLGSAGKYEFHIVENVSGNKISLRIPTTLDAREKLQLVRVPSYVNATVTDTVTCTPWNYKKGTGGVAVVMVAGTLTLNSAIDVSGRGFGGGKSDGSELDSDCMEYPTSSGLYFAESESTLAGHRGEGNIKDSLYRVAPRGRDVPHDPNPNYNRAVSGGGGGNGLFGGGAGGGNGSAGGEGGRSYCIDNYDSDKFLSLGGTEFANSLDTYDIVFMGGGGGTGTGIASDGGAGGGIVIIVAGTIVANNDATIRSNGASAGTGFKPRQGGAGGGGAGGSIMLVAENYVGTLHVELNGGNGGNTDSDDKQFDGAGGGGGCGILLLNKSEDEAPDNIAIKQKPGSEGRNGRVSFAMPGYAMPGAEGELSTFNKFNQHLQTRGFVKNKMLTRDSVVCYHQTVRLAGDKPDAGDNSQYSYLWLTRSNGTSWTVAKGDSSDMDYLTPPLEGNNFFCRVVTVSQIIGGISYSFTDTSSIVNIRALPPIDNNHIHLLVTSDTIICGSLVDLAIQGTLVGQEAGYIWEQRIGEGEWSKIGENQNQRWKLSERDTLVEYHYRRIAGVSNDGITCHDTSAVLTVKMLPSVKGNVLSESQHLCETERPQPLTADYDSDAYTYLWEASFDGIRWSALPNATKDYYRPEQFNGADSVIYRRIVFANGCTDTSTIAVVRFDRLPTPAEILGFGEADSFYFKFRMPVEAAPLTYGHGQWTSVADSLGLSFNPANEAISEVSGLRFGANRIVWTVSNGLCPSSSDSVTIVVRDVVIPDGFSPNGDRKNDCFGVIGADNAEKIELTVVNRANKVVFHSESLVTGEYPYPCLWEGRDDKGNELPAGSYFYQIKLNEKYTYKGYVILRK